MRSRLGSLGVEGVETRTFHSTALAQLGRFGASAAPGPVVEGGRARDRSPTRSRVRTGSGRPPTWPRRSNGRRTGVIAPQRYAGSLGAHEPPIPADLMERVYRQYEQGKQRRELVDFEDLLELTIRLFDDDARWAERFRERTRAITVDEYQDANLLQQTLLEHWLGDRDDLCVVGDDYQSIYGFTGATPAYLLDMPSRFPGCAVIRLEENHRSTPEILEVANRLVPRLGGVGKVLRATRPPGPRPAGPGLRRRRCRSRVPRVGRPHAERGRHPVRADGRAVARELALRGLRGGAGARPDPVPGPGRGVPVPARGTDGPAPSPRRVGLRGRPAGGCASPPPKDSPPVATSPRTSANRRPCGRTTWPDWFGWPRSSTRTRRYQSGRGRRAGRRDRPGVRRRPPAAVRLRRRGARGEPPDVPPRQGSRVRRGVPAASPGGRAAVPPLEDRRGDRGGTSPPVRGHHAGATAPRASRGSPTAGHARAGSSPRSGPGPERLPPGAPRDGPARGGAGPRRRSSSRPAPNRPSRPSGHGDSQRSRADGVPPYVVFHDRTLAEIAGRHPRSRAQLLSIDGVGPTKLERYADEVLAVLGAVGPVGSGSSGTA